MAERGFPLVARTQVLLEKWHDPAHDWHIGGNPGTLRSEKSYDINYQGLSQSLSLSSPAAAQPAGRVQRL